MQTQNTRSSPVISRENNVISFVGNIKNSGIHFPLAELHRAVNSAGYEEIILDFEMCESAFPNQMLALCAQVIELRRSNIDIKLISPKDPELNRLFLNSNWAYYLDPNGFSPGNFKGHKHVPATMFRTPEEQQAATDKIVETILRTIPNIERRDLAALEWSLGELTDNVLMHSDSPNGGLVQVSTFEKKRNVLNFVVADSGIGIPKSLRSGHPEISSDIEALDNAIKEGVTRDSSIGQGNGLYGSYQICSRSNGFFEILSGHAVLIHDCKNGLHVKNSSIPYSGTLISAEIDFSVPHLLEEALKFNGNKHTTVDYLELKYEENTHIKVREEAKSFLSRVDGSPIRIKLINLARMLDNNRIVVDFEGIELISSSFADEVIGKVFYEVGPIDFMKKFEIKNVTQNVRSLIDRAIGQRMSSNTTKSFEVKSPHNEN